jgi:hypothetical protein
VTTPKQSRRIARPNDALEVADGVIRRAPRVREEEVASAADGLLLEGDRPTVERVRQRLGRGSPNTIALFLDRWWAQLGARLRDMPGQELPGVPSTVSAALVSLWSCAIDEARALLKDTLAAQAAEVANQQLALQDQTAALDRNRQEFERERAALGRTVDMLQDQLRVANERNLSDTKVIHELRGDVSRSSEHREQTQQDLLRLTQRLESQAREHEAALLTVRERADASEKHWIKQVDEARQVSAHERKRWENREKNLQDDLTRVTAQLVAAQNESEELRAILSKAHDDSAAQRSRIASLEEAVKLERTRIDLSADGLEARLREAIGNAITWGSQSGLQKRARSASKKQK